MKVLVIGGGGREHAISWKISLSPLVSHVWVAPGNAGTALEPKISNLPIQATDLMQLLEFAKEQAIDLTIVGPEAPLADGIVNLFSKEGVPCFGPTQEASQLESSKAFCKDFMATHAIPTANYAKFTQEESALHYIKDHPYPLVIKADGLAQGKGVVIAETEIEAKQAIHAMLNEHAFGDASNRIVIEEFLEGEELSYIVMVDGNHVLPLASSQDHKRRDDGDKGPNTGGMGAYSPSPLLTKALEEKVLDQVIYPTVNSLRKNKTPYTGFLYAGLMINKHGEPKVLEFNCRLGDPETQPLLMRLKSDLTQLCLLALQGKLNEAKVEWDPRPALAVVLAAGGYPLSYKKGDIIKGLPSQNKENLAAKDVKVFHAGTTMCDDNIVTSGGRVLAATALGETLQEAHELAYKQVNTISWTNSFYRQDIGHKALKKSIAKHEQ